MTMAQTSEQELVDRFRAFVGRSAPPRVADDEVNRAMIRHWCHALGDANPVYTDPEAAARSVHGELIAPPTMLGAWTMRGMHPPNDPAVDPRRKLFAMIEDAGYPAVVATNVEQEYERALRPGDLITETRVIESVSELKKTALGDGYFVTELATFTDRHGEVVGRQRARYLKYKPAPRARKPDGQRPRPSMNQDSAFFWEGLKRGELLIQRCSSCGTLRHPPRAMCSACRSLDWDTLRSSGRGEIYSYVVYHHPPAPGFEVPYVVALVELDEGVRLLANTTDVAIEDVRVGMGVEATFVGVDDELTLPFFRPVE